MSIRVRSPEISQRKPSASSRDRLRDQIREQPPTPASATLSFHDGSADRFRPDHQLFRLESGKVFQPKSRSRSRPDFRKKTRSFPKSNRMTHPPHSVKVETQVVQGVQNLSQHFIGRIKMPQIRAGIALAHAAG